MDRASQTSGRLHVALSGVRADSATAAPAPAPAPAAVASRDDALCSVTLGIRHGSHARDMIDYCFSHINSVMKRSKDKV